MADFKRAFQRGLFGFARGVLPKVTIGGQILLFRDGDCREVLARDHDFTIRQINEENIGRHIGPFMLAMDDGEQRRRETGIMHSIVRQDDVARIREHTRKTAQDLMAKLAGQAEVDLVQEYTRIVPLRMTGDYFGTPGPDDASMLRWNRLIFWDIFMNFKNDEEIRKNSMVASDEMNAYLLDLIAQRKVAKNSGTRLPDDLLSRLITLQDSDEPSFDDDGIRRNLAGSYMGGIEPISKAVCNILGQLFRHKEMMAAAQKAVQAKDIGELGKVVFEAYRFHPNLPVVVRYNEKEQYIGGKDGRKKRKLKAGKKIFAMVGSAMFDKRAWTAPKSFNPNRPRDKYLYFGDGTHKCWGAYINYIVIPEMIMAFFQNGCLHPKSLEVEMDGTFPDKWIFVSK